MRPFEDGRTKEVGVKPVIRANKLSQSRASNQKVI